MSDSLYMFGNSYSNVSGFKAKDEDDNTLIFVHPQGTLSIVYNGTGIDVSHYASIDVNVSSGDIGAVTQDSSGAIVLSADPAGDSGFSMYDFASGAIPRGEVDVSGLTLVNYAFAYRKNITSVVGTGALATYSFYNCTGITKIHISTTNSSNGSFIFGYCSGLKTAVYSSQDAGGSLFYLCSSLEIADLNVPQVSSSYFFNCQNLETIILRKSNSITTMGSGATTIFGTNSRFKSGGVGGTIYIPKALYDHLGDGSSLDYKAATNWSVVDGYGTITWAQIEGSQYEHYYADGTEID